MNKIYARNQKNLGKTCKNSIENNKNEIYHLKSSVREESLWQTNKYFFKHITSYEWKTMSYLLFNYVITALSPILARHLLLHFSLCIQTDVASQHFGPCRYVLEQLLHETHFFGYLKCNINTYMTI